MNKVDSSLKHTIKFMVLFVVFTLVSFISAFLVAGLLSDGALVADILPKGKTLDPAQVNWDRVGSFGGYGLHISKDGELIKSYKTDLKTGMTLADLLAYTDIGNTEESLISYEGPNKTKVLIIYPEKYVSTRPNIQLDAVLGNKAKIYEVCLLSLLIFYLAGTYFLIKRLYRALKKDQEILAREEAQRKDQLFHGLAHDMKTPLAAIIGYAQALEDSLVKDDKKMTYYGHIRRNSQTLKARLDELMDFASLADANNLDMDQRDLLEFIRRYVGDNYSWFASKEARIDLDFSDKAMYVTDFDPKLMERVLQNILQNSIDHNKGPVNIKISMSQDRLIIQDDGVGIKPDLWDKIFEPMVTGDPSRTGSSNRGMGLANVARIIQLHGWEIGYDQRGFVIWIREK